MEEEILVIKNLAKSYSSNIIWNNVNLSIYRGEIIGLVGKSGSGKSTLIKILIGLEEPSKGEILFKTQKKDSVGFSMQNNSIYDQLTVKQNLRYFAKIYGLNRHSRKEIIPQLITALKLESFEKVLVKKLSGGTKKRVDIACSLLRDPEIIILDEPFLGLDPSLVNDLSGLIMELNESGKTIILCSHDIERVYQLCNRIILVKDKKICFLKKNELSSAYN